MSKTAFIRARVNPELKGTAERVLIGLGITPTQAITMLYKVIVFEKRWPLEMKIPNEETRRVFEKTDRGIGLISCKNAEDFLIKMGLSNDKNKISKHVQKRPKARKKTREKS